MLGRRPGDDRAGCRPGSRNSGTYSAQGACRRGIRSRVCTVAVSEEENDSQEAKQNVGYYVDSMILQHAQLLILHKLLIVYVLL
jgi:hypothetical protein